MNSTSISHGSNWLTPLGKICCPEVCCCSLEKNSDSSITSELLLDLTPPRAVYNKCTVLFCNKPVFFTSICQKLDDENNNNDDDEITCLGSMPLSDDTKNKMCQNKPTRPNSISEPEAVVNGVEDSNPVDWSLLSSDSTLRGVAEQNAIPFISLDEPCSKECTSDSETPVISLNDNSVSLCSFSENSDGSTDAVPDNSLSKELNYKSHLSFELSQGTVQSLETPERSSAPGAFASKDGNIDFIDIADSCGSDVEEHKVILVPKVRKKEKIMPRLIALQSDTENQEDSNTNDSASPFPVVAEYHSVEVIDIPSSPEMPRLIPFTSESEENKNKCSDKQLKVVLEKLEYDRYRTENGFYDVRSIQTQGSKSRSSDHPEIDTIDGLNFFGFKTDLEMLTYCETHGKDIHFQADDDEGDSESSDDGEYVDELPSASCDPFEIGDWQMRRFRPENQIPFNIDSGEETSFSKDYEDRVEIDESSLDEVKGFEKVSSDVQLGKKEPFSPAPAQTSKKVAVGEKGSNMNAFFSEDLENFLKNESQLRVPLLQRFNPNITPIPKNATILSIGNLKRIEDHLHNQHIASGGNELFTSEKDETHKYRKRKNNFMSDGNGQSSNTVTPLKIRKQSAGIVASAKVLKKSRIFKSKYDSPNSPRLVMRLKKESTGTDEGYKVADSSDIDLDEDYHPDPNDDNYQPSKSKSSSPKAPMLLIREVMFSDNNAAKEKKLLDEFLKNLKGLGSINDLTSLVNSKKAYCNTKTLHKIDVYRCLSVVTSVSNLKKKKAKQINRPQEFNKSLKMKAKRGPKKKVPAPYQEAASSLETRRRRSIKLPRRFHDSAVMTGSEWVYPVMSSSDYEEIVKTKKTNLQSDDDDDAEAIILSLNDDATKISKRCDYDEIVKSKKSNLKDAEAITGTLNANTPRISRRGDYEEIVKTKKSNLQSKDAEAITLASSENAPRISRRLRGQNATANTVEVPDSVTPEDDLSLLIENHENKMKLQSQSKDVGISKKSIISQRMVLGSCGLQPLRSTENKDLHTGLENKLKFLSCEKNKTCKDLNAQENVPTQIAETNQNEKDGSCKVLDVPEWEPYPISKEPEQKIQVSSVVSLNTELDQENESCIDIVSHPCAVLTESPGIGNVPSKSSVLESIPAVSQKLHAPNKLGVSSRETALSKLDLNLNSYETIKDANKPLDYSSFTKKRICTVPACKCKNSSRCMAFDFSSRRLRCSCIDIKKVMAKLGDSVRRNRGSGNSVDKTEKKIQKSASSNLNLHNYSAIAPKETKVEKNIVEGNIVTSRENTVAIRNANTSKSLLAIPSNLPGTITVAPFKGNITVPTSQKRTYVLVDPKSNDRVTVPSSQIAISNNVVAMAPSAIDNSSASRLLSQLASSINVDVKRKLVIKSPPSNNVSRDSGTVVTSNVISSASLGTTNSSLSPTNINVSTSKPVYLKLSPEKAINLTGEVQNNHVSVKSPVQTNTPISLPLTTYFTPSGAHSSALSSNSGEVVKSSISSHSLRAVRVGDRYILCPTYCENKGPSSDNVITLYPANDSSVTPVKTNKPSSLLTIQTSPKVSPNNPSSQPNNSVPLSPRAALRNCQPINSIADNAPKGVFLKALLQANHQPADEDDLVDIETMDCSIAGGQLRSDSSFVNSLQVSQSASNSNSMDISSCSDSDSSSGVDDEQGEDVLYMGMKVKNIFDTEAISKKHFNYKTIQERMRRSALRTNLRRLKECHPDLKDSGGLLESLNKATTIVNKLKSKNFALAMQVKMLLLRRAELSKAWKDQLIDQPAAIRKAESIITAQRLREAVNMDGGRQFPSPPSPCLALTNKKVIEYLKGRPRLDIESHAQMCKQVYAMVAGKECVENEDNIKSSIFNMGYLRKVQTGLNSKLNSSESESSLSSSITTPKKSPDRSSLYQMLKCNEESIKSDEELDCDDPVAVVTNDIPTSGSVRKEFVECTPNSVSCTSQITMQSATVSHTSPGAVKHFDEEAHNSASTSQISSHKLPSISNAPSGCESGGPSDNNSTPGEEIQLISDKPVLSRARASLPASHLYFHQVDVDPIGNPVYGVFAKTSISQRTHFGPIEGITVQSEKPPNEHFQFILDMEDNLPLYIDTADESVSNWMSFVRPAENVEEQNLILIQKGFSLYFSVICDIRPQKELRVWYSYEYASKWNLPALKQGQDEPIDYSDKASKLPPSAPSVEKKRSGTSFGVRQSDDSTDLQLPSLGLLTKRSFPSLSTEQPVTAVSPTLNKTKKSLSKWYTSFGVSVSDEFITKQSHKLAPRIINNDAIPDFVPLVIDESTDCTVEAGKKSCT